MANSTAITTSFKVDLLVAYHNFGTTVTRGGTGADTFMAALYLTTGSVGAATTAYSSSNEVSGTNYTAGGVAVTNATAPTSSGTPRTGFASSRVVTPPDSKPRSSRASGTASPSRSLASPPPTRP